MPEESGPRPAPSYATGLEAFLGLTGAAALLAWDDHGLAAASRDWSPDAGTILKARTLLGASHEPLFLEPTDPRVGALLDDCPESCAQALFVTPDGGTSGLLLGFLEAETAPRDLNFDAFAEVAARTATPVTDPAFLLATARLATAGNIANGIAHDVGTPLNVISGYAEFLRMSAEPDTPLYKGLTTILDQTHRISEMIRELLVAVRAPVPTRERKPVGAFAAEALQFSSYMLRKAEVKGTVDATAAPDASIVGDIPRLRHAVFNVLANAARAVGPGGRLSLTPVLSDGATPAIEIGGVTPSSAPADLRVLVDRTARTSPNDFLEMLLAERILHDHGGTLAHAPGDSAISKVTITLPAD